MTSKSVEISLRFSERFDRQLRNQSGLFDPTSYLEVRIGDTYGSVDEFCCEVVAIEFFIDFLTSLCKIDKSENKEVVQLSNHYMHMPLHRDGDELTIALRYSEAAIDDPEERLEITKEATAELDEVALAAIDGAEQVSERVAAVLDDSDHGKLHRLDATIETARERFRAE